MSGRDGPCDDGHGEDTERGSEHGEYGQQAAQGVSGWCNRPNVLLHSAPPSRHCNHASNKNAEGQRNLASPPPDMIAAVTVANLLARELRRDGARPFLTWYDDATGDRVELSVATTANWAAKIANHLVDELDVGPGQAVVVEPAEHWSTAVVLLGVWTGGGHVTFGGQATLDVALDAMGLGLSRLVGAQPDDVVVPVHLSGESALTLGSRTWSHDEIAAAALNGAKHHGLDASCRVLSTLRYDTVDGLDAGLLIPLAAGASVALVAHAALPALAERCMTERVTHTAGVDVAGVPRLDR